jgi:hypothetical protein
MHCGDREAETGASTGAGGNFDGAGTGDETDEPSGVDQPQPVGAGGNFDGAGTGYETDEPAGVNQPVGTNVGATSGSAASGGACVGMHMGSGSIEAAGHSSSCAESICGWSIGEFLRTIFTSIQQPAAFASFAIARTRVLRPIYGSSRSTAGGTATKAGQGTGAGIGKRTGFTAVFSWAQAEPTLRDRITAQIGFQFRWVMGFCLLRSD